MKTFFFYCLFIDVKQHLRLKRLHITLHSIIYIRNHLNLGVYLKILRECYNS